MERETRAAAARKRQQQQQEQAEEQEAAKRLKNEERDKRADQFQELWSEFEASHPDFLNDLQTFSSWWASRGFKPKEFLFSIVKTLAEAGELDWKEQATVFLKVESRYHRIDGSSGQAYSKGENRLR